MPVTEQLCDSLYAVCFFPSLVLLYSVYDRKVYTLSPMLSFFLFSTGSKNTMTYSNIMCEKEDTMATSTVFYTFTSKNPKHTCCNSWSFIQNKYKCDHWHFEYLLSLAVLNQRLVKTTHVIVFKPLATLLVWLIF